MASSLGNLISKEKENKENESNMVDIPDLPLDQLEEAMNQTQEDKTIKDESGGSVVFGVIGTGQGGGRLAESFYKLGYKKCLAVNTAEHDLNGLKSLPDNQKLLFNTGTAGGAGKDMERGREAAEKNSQTVLEKLQELFGQVDRILICAGSGGGSGGGSCLTLVSVAKRYLTYLGVEDVNSKVGVVLTLPTSGECASPVVASNAHALATSLCDMADKKEIGSLIIFDNDKIKNLYPNLTVNQFWPTVNATVSGLFHVFNVLSTKTGNPTTFDPTDYSKVLSSGGCTIMGLNSLSKIENGNDVSKAIRDNLERTLLCTGFDLKTASTAACIATASENMLNNVAGLMNSLESGFDTLANVTGNATVFRGIYESEKEKLVIYTMLSGLSSPKKRLNELLKFQQLKK